MPPVDEPCDFAAPVDDEATIPGPPSGRLIRAWPVKRAPKMPTLASVEAEVASVLGEGWRDDVPAIVEPCRDEAPPSNATREREWLEANPGPHGTECFGGSDYDSAAAAYREQRVEAMRERRELVSGPYTLPSEQRTQDPDSGTARSGADRSPAAACVAQSAPSLVLSERGVSLWRATHLQLAEVARAAGGVDAIVCDPPYSERTHKGHDDGTSQANRVADWGAREAAKGKTRKSGGVSLTRMVEYAETNGTERKALDYPPWTDADVESFVATWAPLNHGWFAMFTDHVLAPSWERHLEAAGLYVFSPLACVEPGSRFRAVGDGPSQWSVWLVVARPRTMAWLDAWRARRVAEGAPRALRGAHIVGDGEGDKRTGSRGDRVTGAKPLSMMRGVVSDYSCAGELVCDPTCGGGTTGDACVGLGRMALLGDSDASHVEIAAERLRLLPTQARKGTLALDFGRTGT